MKLELVVQTDQTTGHCSLFVFVVLKNSESEELNGKAQINCTLWQLARYTAPIFETATVQVINQEFTRKCCQPVGPVNVRTLPILKF